VKSLGWSESYCPLTCIQRSGKKWVFTLSKTQHFMPRSFSDAFNGMTGIESKNDSQSKFWNTRLHSFFVRSVGNKLLQVSRKRSLWANRFEILVNPKKQITTEQNQRHSKWVVSWSKTLKKINQVVIDCVRWKLHPSQRGLAPLIKRALPVGV